MSRPTGERPRKPARALASFLRAHGFPHAETPGGGAGDITGAPGLVFVLHAVKPLVRAEATVPAWMVETEAQRAAAGADLGVLVVRRDQRPEAEWFAFLPVADLYGIAGAEAPVRAEGPANIPPPWGAERDTIVAWPARLYLGDLVTLLRAAGWGDPLPAEPEPATPPELREGAVPVE